jgi:glyoxalase family protein
MLIKGIHHVTALASDPKRNLTFYRDLLGLRLVKRTVNFDDPTTYHFYFGDHAGSPGTIMTFFPHPLARPGVRGAGEVGTTTFAVPAGSLPAWAKRLQNAGVNLNRIDDRIRFADADGTSLALIERPGRAARHWTDGPLDESHAIIGFDRVEIVERRLDRLVRLLVDVLGFEQGPSHAGVTTFRIGDGGLGKEIDVRIDEQSPAPRLGAGSVHHVALRVADDDDQTRVADALAQSGYHATEVQDRNYFRSIYFRHPGGTLFEIATDGPGFAIDEPENRLGESLKLPEQFESQRRQIESVLPTID